MTSPSISVIIPTWNEELWLRSLLGRLEAVSGVDEIIVADNDSDDSTATVARDRGCLIVRGGRPALGRNTGARATGGEVLLFVDADVGIAPSNVAHIQRRLSDPACNLVYFRLVPKTTRRSFRVPYRGLDAHARLASRFNRPGLSAPLIAVRASVFREVGGFDEGITAAEDAGFRRGFRPVEPRRCGSGGSHTARNGGRPPGTAEHRHPVRASSRNDRQ